MIYTVFSVEGENCAGMFQSPMEMSYWSMYFNVDDCRAMTESARAAGASIMVEPQHAPGVGTFSFAGDPQGAMFGLLEPEPTP